MGFVQYIRRYENPRTFSAGMGLCLVSGLLPAAQIRLQARVVDAALAGGEGFDTLLTLYILLLAAGTLTAALLRRNIQRHQHNVSFRMDRERLEKANAVCFETTETAQFHTLLERARSMPELDSQICQALQTIVLVGVTMVFSLMVLWETDRRTVLGIVLFLALGIWLNLSLARQTDGFWGNYIENMRFTNYLAALLLQREYSAERKLFAFGGEIGKRFQAEFTKAKKENQKLGRGRLQMEVLLEVFSAVYSVTVVLLLLAPLSAGRITLGSFTAAFYGANTLRRSGTQLYQAVYSLRGSWKRMTACLSFLELPQEREAEQGVPREAVSIEFRDVSFAYPGQAEPVLEHISLTLVPGKHYALVGENGCGKTTLVKLLVGLYQPTQGQILVNGIPLYTLHQKEKQRIFSAVFQDFYRFPLSIRENVALGMDGQPEDAALEGVFEALDFHPAVLSQAGGMDRSLQLMQKDGTGLSGGEWQKLAIARCILSGRPVAVLDEPNAALDPMAEAEVYRAYRELLRDRTTLFISHRLGSVKSADEILVLRKKSLIARGSHETLMETCGYYAELFEAQRGMYYESGL